MRVSQQDLPNESGLVINRSEQKSRAVCHLYHKWAMNSPAAVRDFFLEQCFNMCDTSRSMSSTLVVFVLLCGTRCVEVTTVGSSSSWDGWAGSRGVLRVVTV